MIGMRTILEVADNSGARRLACILPRVFMLSSHFASIFHFLLPRFKRSLVHKRVFQLRIAGLKKRSCWRQVYL